MDSINIESNMVLDVNVYHPSEIYYFKDEVADPNKILTIIASSFENGIGHIPYHIRSKEVSTIVSSGFIVDCNNLMFKEFHTLSLRDWFSKYWFSQFIITSCIWSDTLSDFPFKWSNSVVNIDTFPIIIVNSSIQEILITLKVHHAYTVCNGVTVLLALHRKNLVKTKEVLYLLQSLPALIFPFDESYLSYYFQHPIPMVSEMPEYYSIRDSNIEVVKYLFERNMHLYDNFEEEDEEDDEDIYTGFEYPNKHLTIYESPSLVIYTNPFSAMFNNKITLERLKFVNEFQPWLLHLGDNSIPDIIGFLRTICTKEYTGKPVWRWLINGGLKNLNIHKYYTNEDIDTLAKPLFYLYSFVSSPKFKHRLYVIWKLLGEFYGNGNMVQFCINHITNTYLYNIPFEFLMYYTRDNYYIYKIIEPMEFKTPTLYKYCRVFNKIKDKRAKFRLLAIKHTFHVDNASVNHPFNHVIGDIMIDYIKKNKEVLYV